MNKTNRIPVLLIHSQVGTVSLSEKETPLFIDAISGEVQVDQGLAAKTLSFWQRLFG